MADIIERIERGRMSDRTHWEGCHSVHVDCGAIHEISTLRAQLAEARGRIPSSHWLELECGAGHVYLVFEGHSVHGCPLCQSARIATLERDLAEAQAKVAVLKDSEECSHQIIMSRGVELEEMDTRIATLERDLAEAQGRVCELAFLNQKLLASIATLERENAELAADKARLDWFFGPDEKYPFLATYMEGVRAGWNVDQWRAAIDAAMHPAEPDAGDGGEGAR